MYIFVFHHLIKREKKTPEKFNDWKACSTGEIQSQPWACFANALRWRQSSRCHLVQQGARKPQGHVGGRGVPPGSVHDAGEGQRPAMLLFCWCAGNAKAVGWQQDSSRELGLCQGDVGTREWGGLGYATPLWPEEMLLFALWSSSTQDSAIWVTMIWSN